MIDKSLRKRALKAASRYLELMGYEIVDTKVSKGVDFVAFDPASNTLAFIAVSVHERGAFDSFAIDGVLASAKERREFEKTVVRFSETHDFTDCRIVLSKLSILLTAPDRAIIRFASDVPFKE